MTEFLIYGAGGFAREVAWLAEQCGHSVVGFIDDEARRLGSPLNEIRILGLEDAVKRYPTARVLAAIGNPAARERVMAKATSAGLEPGTLIHPRVERSRWVTVGPGSVICAGSILTTNITVGSNVQINLDCTIGHDVVMEDYATLAPGVHVSGWVRLEKACYVGTGANIINGTPDAPLVIGADAVIGAGACVTKSVPAGVTAVGVPAKALARR
jgi:sugar O-acyltransferase (sialic acid O-acetyltransferase NeuD family)